MKETAIFDGMKMWLLEYLQGEKNYYQTYLQGVIKSNDTQETIEKMILRLQGRPIDDEKTIDKLIELELASLSNLKLKNNQKFQLLEDYNLLEEQELLKRIEEVSSIAAKWWADSIDMTSIYHLPEIIDENKTDNIIIKKIIQATQKKQVHKSIVVKIFKAILKDEIAKRLKHRVANIVLYTEYGPMDTLFEISKKSGILSKDTFEGDISTILPWQTQMNINLNNITVKIKYIDEPTTLFERYPRNEKVKILNDNSN